MNALHDRIDRLIANLEEENRALTRLLASGHSIEEADDTLRGLTANPAPPRSRQRRARGSRARQD
jgi:hypothetical protein